MSEDIRISDDIVIPLGDVEIQAVRAQGAGGQNVNKVATAIHLRFNFRDCEAIPEQVRARIAKLDDNRVTAGGIVIKAQEYRSQSRNRQAAIERLQELIRCAISEVKPRIPTRPSRKARVKRIEEKRRQGQLKKSRGPIKEP